MFICSFPNKHFPSRVILGMARTERKDSLDSLGRRVFLAVPVSLGSAMLEHLDSEESLESLVYQVYLDSQVYQDQEVSETSTRPM